ncbi:VOC family protein [Peribacillus sp. NJ11]|uniref:VOC family protein n=1 Tax=Peribacillus sp. NJ11 TaxID=3055861 RepID=UPI0025A1F3F8|nr:VOC family protein [Peribacillus sp. NJ11]MDM5221844.1 VOC family protein [Peribacillus sp. NJ11]
MTAITHIGLAVPDLDAAIKWYEQVLGFRLLAGPYSFDVAEENENNMTNDLLGDTVKMMRNAHLMADNSVRIELFEFEEARMPKSKSRGYEGFFHICLIADDIESLTGEIASSGEKGVAIYGVHGRTIPIIQYIVKILSAISLNFTAEARN